MMARDELQQNDELAGQSRKQTGPPVGAAAEASRGQAAQLLLGLLFGIAFGFLLQKGGVAKYEVLMGMLLLRDFTVLKVILSAVVVGMLGIHAMHAAGLVKLHIKPTRYGANILGGIVFGIGFGLAAYCPGTSAAALGQGNWDAVSVMVGMMAGSYLFAEASSFLARTVNRWGERGELTLTDLLRARTAWFVPVMAALVLLMLVAVHLFIDPTP